MVRQELVDIVPRLDLRLIRLLAGSRRRYARRSPYRGGRDRLPLLAAAAVSGSSSDRCSSRADRVADESGEGAELRIAPLQVFGR
jgi:hypothetical protein